MSTDNWRELYLLAAQLCPMVLADLPSLVARDAYGVLQWLRRKARECQQ